MMVKICIGTVEEGVGYYDGEDMHRIVHKNLGL